MKRYLVYYHDGYAVQVDATSPSDARAQARKLARPGQRITSVKCLDEP